MKKPAAVYPWQAFILVSSGIWSKEGNAASALY